MAMSSRCSGSDMMQLFQGFCGVISLRLWCYFSGMTAPSQCNNIENSMQQEHHRNGTVIVSQRKNPLPTLLQGFCHCCHLAVTEKLADFQRINPNRDSSVGRKPKTFSRKTFLIFSGSPSILLKSRFSHRVNFWELN